MGPAMTIGMEMMVKYKNKQSQVDYVKDEKKDDSKTKKVKSIIRQMVVFEPKKRISMMQVAKQLETLNGQY